MTSHHSHASLFSAAHCLAAQDQHQTPDCLTRAVEAVVRRRAAWILQGDGARVRAPRCKCARDLVHTGRHLKQKWGRQTLQACLQDA
ncbi:hypothetical protein DUNSADRAFT_15723 [Dunaliella salina]|uniref:Encoded protein n=1 Tax=Dunaliella salina TaxID=3046 RepID=A0ABQ7H997_DUNSA|nr:hypothetical protein DUNSADRAFT_15723 [Dunaliella salina]|eukprot:KAF5843428.1 hypothetical protein DUNSADRAFT_15723 [Dunaliella salina]